MNMIDAQVCKESGADVTLTFGGHTLTLPQSKGQSSGRSWLCRQGRLLIGIRPEDLHDEEAFLADKSKEHDSRLAIRVYEMLGAEVLLYFDIDDATLYSKG